MPIFRAQIEKFHQYTSEYWVNRYFINAATIEDAAVSMNGIRDAERQLYTSFITVTKGHVDDMQPNTDVYLTPTWNMAGTRPAPTGQMFPLFVVARVDLTVAGYGRPSRKYLRGVLWEGDADINLLEANMLTMLGQYGTNIAAAGACDPQGQDIISGAGFPAPAMRQLRRGSKKKVTP